MIKEIKAKKFKPNKLTIVMFYAEGCHACESAKPVFEEISNQYKDVDFAKIKMAKESYEDIYNLYEEKTEKIIEQAVDSENKAILSKNGTPMQRFKLDENGEIAMKSSIVVPNFFFFHPDSAEKDDKLGFLGNVRGLDLDKVKNIIEQMKEMEQDEQN